MQDIEEDNVAREQWDMVRWDKEDQGEGVGWDPRHE